MGLKRVGLGRNFSMMLGLQDKKEDHHVGRKVHQDLLPDTTQEAVDSYRTQDNAWGATVSYNRGCYSPLYYNR